MKFGSVCSGIEAASVAWHSLGWSASFLSEIEAFPRAVLAHHYPAVPLHGDFTTIQKDDYAAIDLLVGGTPCQSFSVAGLRQGLRDPRGNLMLEFGALAGRLEPRWIVWENVPGCLSSGGGRDFGSFLGMLGLLGYGFAYRVLDAQYFGVAQRRRRVFVVGYLGDWRPAAAVLFERHSLQGHPAPRREARKVAPTIPSRSTGGGGLGTDFDCDGGVIQVCPTLRAGGNRTGGDRPPGTDVDTADSLIPIGVTIHGTDGTGRGTPLVPVGVTIHGTDGTARVASYDDTAQCLRARTPGNIDNSSTTVVQQPVAFTDIGQGQRIRTADATSETLRATKRGPYTDYYQVHGQQHHFCHRCGEPSAPICGLCEASDCVTAMPVAFSIMPMNSGKDYKARETEVAQPLMAGGPVGGNQGGDFVAQPVAYSMITANTGANGLGVSAEIAPTLDRAQPAAVAFHPTQDPISSTDVCHAIGTGNGQGGRHDGAAVAFEPGSIARNAGPAGESELAPRLRRNMGDNQPAVRLAMQVRRLTPVECERLQGFPDGWTQIPWRGKPADQCPDGPRYKALGNSMAVPVMHWIGRRIAAVDGVL